MPNGATRKTKPVGTYGSITSARRGVSYTYRSTRYRDLGTLKVHRLVCEAFHGPAPFDRAVVLHINEDAHDNRPENLKWGTQKENLNMPVAKERFRARVGEKSSIRIAKMRQSQQTLEA
jgi:hypothetical protein